MRVDETRQIVDALKRVLKTRDLTYESLGRRINLSEASVKRVFAQRTFTLKRLEQICRALDMSMADLVRAVDRKDYRTTTLSLEQEAALADYQRDALDAAYLTLTGNAVTEAIRVAAIRAQQKAVNDTLDIDRQNLALVQTERQAGTVPDNDVVTAESQLAADELREQVELALGALDVTRLCDGFVSGVARFVFRLCHGD